MERIKEQMERWKVLAETFLKEDKRVYIKDSSNNIYFAEIIFIGEDTLTLQCFAPEQRAGKTVILYWPLIVKLDEYREVENWSIE